MPAEKRIVEVPLTAEHLKVLGVSPNAADAEIVSQLLALLTRESETFGSVRWHDEDIADALEQAELPATKENIAAVRAQCEHHYFVDAQIDTGWNCINAYISEVFHKEAAS